MTLESPNLECVPGTNLYYCIAGNPEGKPVFLIHGWGTDHRYFDFQLKPLQDYRLIIPDLEGFGSSSTEKKPKSFSIQDQADKIHRLANHLGIGSAVVIGHSMGGMIALELAHTKPDFIKGLVLEDTSPGLRLVRFSNIISAFGFLIYGAVKPLRVYVARRWAISYEHASETAKGMITEYARTNCCKTLVRYVRAMRKWSVPDNGSSLEMPALIIQGSEDRLLGADHTKLLEGHLPNSRTVIIERSGHSPHLEQPEAFNREVLIELKEVFHW